MLTLTLAIAAIRLVSDTASAYLTHLAVTVLPVLPKGLSPKNHDSLILAPPGAGFFLLC